ncbi:MAG: metallophosphoesterase [Myxococcota bacterium]|nr:metallophosphoesterase [Myxococcota bacterium]
MSYRIVGLLFASLMVAVTFGCQKKEEAAAEVKVPAVQKAEKVDVKAPEIKGEDTTGTTDPACVGKFGEGPKQDLEVQGGSWERSGSTLRYTGTSMAELRVGVLSDIKDASEANLRNLEAFRTEFEKAKVQLVLITGDLGESEEDIVAGLDVLVKLQVPVLAVIGNREGRGVFTRGLQTANAKNPLVQNFNQIRTVVTPVGALYSLPGYFDPEYLHAKDGCLYGKADIDALTGALSKAPAGLPRVLVSHGGPQMTGDMAIDMTADGKHTGDPAMLELVKSQGIQCGIFGNIHEAGGKATGLTGASILSPGEWHPSLYLNPGPADSVRWAMNDKSESVGMAAVVTFKGGKAKYEIHRRSAGAEKL